MSKNSFKVGNDFFFPQQYKQNTKMDLAQGFKITCSYPWENFAQPKNICIIKITKLWNQSLM